jgi:hypothetical protein
MIHFHLLQSLNTNTQTQRTHIITQGNEKKANMKNVVPFHHCLHFLLCKDGP